LVRTEWPDGQKWFYEGEKGAERLVRSEWPDGEKRFYEGAQGAERKVRAEWPDGNKHFYEGEKGSERLVRIEDPNGDKSFCEGEKGAERVVRAEFPSGQKQFYEGEKGAERVVRVEYPDGRKDIDEGGGLPTTSAPPPAPPSPPSDEGTTEPSDALDAPAAPAAKRPRAAGPARDSPNGKPEREFVRRVAAEWEAAGIAVVGKERADEVAIRLNDGTTEYLDMHCSKGERVCLVEFKADAHEFNHGTGQLLGYAHCMRDPAHDAGDGGAYAAAHAKGAASLCVATPTKPKQAHIDFARKNVPSVGAWWPGCPPPL
jgi:hypothetical protein